MKYLCKLGRTLRPQQTVTQKWQAEFVWQQVKTKQSTQKAHKKMVHCVYASAFRADC